MKPFPPGGDVLKLNSFKCDAVKPDIKASRDCLNLSLPRP